MSLMEILKYPDPLLRVKAQEVEEVDDEIRALLDDMVESMYDDKGIGLAAVQVGVAKRVIIIDIPDDEHTSRGTNLVELINPEIISAHGDYKFEEGCLSVPGVNAYVKRSASVLVHALDRRGNPVEIEGEDILAVALQHEIDHLDGVLFIDRLSFVKRDIIKRRYRKLREADKEAL